MSYAGSFDRCACTSRTRAVQVTPPGDARPAFPDDIEFVNRIYEEQFGMSIIPEGQIALLNKVPDNDRMEEIVVGGAIVGAIRCLPQRILGALPRPEAALIEKPKRRLIVIDDGAVMSVRTEEVSWLLVLSFVTLLSGKVMRSYDDKVRNMCRSWKSKG